MLLVTPLLSFVIFGSSKRLLQVTFTLLLVPFIVGSSLLFINTSYEIFRIIIIISISAVTLYFGFLLFKKYGFDLKLLFQEILLFIKKYWIFYIGIGFSIILWLFFHSFSQDQNAYIKFGIEYMNGDGIHSLGENRTYTLPSVYYTTMIFGYKNAQYFYNIFIPLLTLSIFIWSSVSIFDNFSKYTKLLSLLLSPLLMVIPSLLNITTRSNITFGSLIIWLLATHIYKLDETSPLFWMSLISFSTTSLILMIFAATILFVFFLWNKQIKIHIFMALFCCLLYSFTLIGKNTMPSISLFAANILLVGTLLLFKYEFKEMDNYRIFQKNDSWKKILFIIISFVLAVTLSIIFIKFTSVSPRPKYIINYDFFFGTMKDPNFIFMGIIFPTIIIGLLSLDKRGLILAANIVFSLVSSIFLAEHFPTFIYSYLPFRFYSSLWVVSAYVSILILIQHRRDIFIAISSTSVYCLFITMLATQLTNFITFGTNIKYNKEIIPSDLISYVDSSSMWTVGAHKIYSDFAISKTTLSIKENQIEYFLPYIPNKYDVDLYDKTLFRNTYHHLSIETNLNGETFTKQILVSEYYNNKNTISHIKKSHLSYILFEKARHIRNLNGYKILKEGSGWILFKKI